MPRACLSALVPTFSQGQLRLLLLGRALLRAPTFALLDECDEGLDERYRQIFFETLGEYASRCTVVMTAHRAANIPDWCAGRRYVRNGRLLTAPPASDAAATALTTDQQGNDPAVLDQAFNGGHAMLDLDNVTVFIDEQEVLHDICVDMRSGESSAS